MNETALALQDQSFGGRFEVLMKAADQFAKSAIIPDSYRGKPADVFVALEWGTELGMQPMASLQNIYVVKGRPTLSAQTMAGLVKGRQDYQGMVIDSDGVKAKAVVKRKLQSGVIEEHIGEFTIQQADKANLLSKDNWKAYPQQMLEARAIAFSMRKAYPDILAGIYTKEEVEDFGPEKNISGEATVNIGKPNQPPPPSSMNSSPTLGKKVENNPNPPEADNGPNPKTESKDKAKVEIKKPTGDWKTGRGQVLSEIAKQFAPCQINGELTELFTPDEQAVIKNAIQENNKECAQKIANIDERYGAGGMTVEESEDCKQAIREAAYQYLVDRLTEVADSRIKRIEYMEATHG